MEEFDNIKEEIFVEFYFIFIENGGDYFVFFIGNVFL